MIVLAGANGAGKSTLYATRVAPNFSGPFINADNIQREELGDASPHAAYESARIAADKRQAFLSRGEDFVTETVFSHPSKLDLIFEARANDFDIVLMHIGVDSPDISVERVAARVEGGRTSGSRRQDPRALRPQRTLHSAGRPRGESWLRLRQLAAERIPQAPPHFHKRLPDVGASGPALVDSGALWRSPPAVGPPRKTAMRRFLTQGEVPYHAKELRHQEIQVADQAEKNSDLFFAARRPKPPKEGGCAAASNRQGLNRLPGGASSRHAPRFTTRSTARG